MPIPAPPHSFIHAFEDAPHLKPRARPKQAPPQKEPPKQRGLHNASAAARQKERGVQGGVVIIHQGAAGGAAIITKPQRSPSCATQSMRRVCYAEWVVLQPQAGQGWLLLG